jgi:predicted phosphodiesterase
MFIALIAHIGDVVQSNGNLKEWKTYWMGPLNEKNIGQRTPIVVARGNHDGNHPFAYSYIFNPGFTNSWFAFNVFTSERKYETSTRIIVLDSNWEDPEENGIRDRQTIWLEYELSHPASKKAAVRVVLLHVPPYLEYWDPKVYEEENQKWGDFIRKEWQPLFETHRVNLVVSGHSHIYQKGEVDGTTYVILGGGGAPLDQEKASDLKIYKTTVKSHHYGIYEFKENEFRMTVLNEHDELIDKFQIHSKRVGFDDD